MFTVGVTDADPDTVIPVPPDTEVTVPTLDVAVVLIVNLALLVLATLTKPLPAISTSSLLPSDQLNLILVVEPGTAKSYVVSPSLPV